MRYLSVAVLLFVLVACSSTDKTEIVVKEYLVEDVSVDSKGFDSIRARADGADDYGMRKYVMAFLKRGPNRDLDSAEAAQLQRAHLDNIGKMDEAGKLALAGPFLDNGDIRGIYIFNVTTLEEAEELTNSDPAIQSGSLVMELRPWYGSAALFEVSDIHGKIAKVNI